MPSLMTKKKKKNLINICFTNSNPSFPIQLPSLHADDKNQHNSAVVVKNFNSVYDLISDPENAAVAAASDPDFATVLASRRFFFSSPGLSNSIIDSSSSSSSLSPSTSNSPLDPQSDIDVIIEGGGIAIPTYSPNPYKDFRRSMEEMVNARYLFDVKSNCNWEWLHELLLCYLALNPKSTHKFIVCAFDDLLVSLQMESPATAKCR